MNDRKNDNRALWLVAGVMVGLCLAYFWPHEPVRAGTADRNDKFAILACQTGGNHDAIFVLDFLTGRLVGANLDRTGSGFAISWVHSVAADFNVDPQATPNYAIAAGGAALPQRGGSQWATSVLYIAEMSSGKVNCYAIPFREAATKVAQPISLVGLDSFEFRQAALK